ncbi:multidrug effflux MFS transporter [Maritimibacter sp. DP1N21-5]|nr:multidrug effflux MFS transporter [Maritimibacter sp. DP1N21-5]MBV7409089.1 multidrug effflux MFS transporter [Maritimibacter sp. DP1N21-5]
MTQAYSARFLDKTTPPHISTLILVTSLAALSMNVFLPSLPEMAEDFSVDYRFMQLSVAIYLGMNAVLQIILGPISDRYGRRPVLLASFAVYIVASLGCIFAPTIGVFLVFRMAQAFVVTGMILSRAIIRDVLPAEQAASFIAYVTMGMSLVPMFSPSLGGFLGEFFGWRSTFWLQVVAGLLIFWMMWRDLGETHPRGEQSLREQLRAYPELLMSPRFWGYSLAAMFSTGCFFAYLGGGPFVGSEVYHLSAAVLGLYFGAPGVGYLAGNWITGRYAVRVGINRMMLSGSLVITVGLVLCLAVLFTGSGTAPVFFGFMLFVGLGNGMVLPNANSGMLSVRPKLAGSASGLGGAMMIGGGAAISGFVGSLLTEEAGPYPLLWLMFLSSLLSIFAVLLVIWRERRVGALV